MGSSRMRRSDVTFGSGCGARFRKGGHWFAWVAEGATWSLGTLRLANGRAEAEKPAAAGAGRARKEAGDATG